MPWMSQYLNIYVHNVQQQPNTVGIVLGCCEKDSYDAFAVHLSRFLFSVFFYIIHFWVWNFLVILLYY